LNWRRAAAACVTTLLLVLLRLVPVLAGEPPQQPFLRIEAGGHTSAVAHLAVDAAGTLLATASYDKTLRLWSLPDGAPRAVLRPPIGTLQEGELYALAMAPDGSRVFAAGATGGQWDGTFSIYAFDTAGGGLIGRLPGLPAPVNDLAVSADGGRLAAGLAKGGVRVWDARSGKSLFEDTTYAGPVRSIALDREGRLFVASADGNLRAYDPSGRKLAQAPLPSHLRPWGIALSPDGGLLAVTSETADRNGLLHVDVVSARTLAPMFAPNTEGLAGEGLLAVAWAADDRGGVQLLAGGYAHDGRGYLIRRWGDFGLGGHSDITVSRDTIRAIVPLPGGGVAYAAEDPGWGRLGPDGRVQRRPKPPLADLRAAREQRLALSADGTVVEFGTAAGLQRFSVVDRRLKAAGTTAGKGLATARVAAPGLALVDWRDSNAPSLNGRKLALEPNEIARSSAILPGDAAVLLGTDTHLRLFARDGQQLGAVDTPAAAWAVTVAANGHLAVAALLDGSLRWYGLGGGQIEERAALFAHADGVRWLLFTPEGFFDHADLGGNDLVGVHLNRGANQQPEWVSFSQAYRVLYAPAVVRARLMGDLGPARARLAELGDIRARLARQPLAELSQACLPLPDLTCQLLRWRPGEALKVPASADSIRLTVQVTERGEPAGPLDVFVNDRNAGRRAPPQGGGPVIVDAPLDPGANMLQFRVYDQKGSIFSLAAPLRVDRGGAVAEEQRGRLFILAVGIDHYVNPALTLRFAVADAKAFTAGVGRAATNLYSKVEVTTLLDDQATKIGILAAFDRLAREVRPEDTFLFYVASHGVLDENTNRFLLVPHDIAGISSWEEMARQSIDEGTLVGALSRIEARDALLFLDTCHSGKVTADSLANMGHETGRYILAASSSVQEAMDSYDDRNGVFVYAVREALAGRAGEDAQGNLGALTLGEYVSRRVGELARQKGHDQDAVFRTAQQQLRSFPIAHIGR
jgi:hypothetical protein